MSFIKQASLIAVLAVTTALPSFAQDHSSETVLATVNGTDIKLGHIVALVDSLPDQYNDVPFEALYNGVLDQLIQQTLLEQATKINDKKIAFALDNERRALVSGEALKNVTKSALNADAVTALYEEQIKNAEPTPEYQASHILLETEEAANEVLQMLKDGGDFAELAKEKSTGPSGPNGGDLGWFGRGAMVPEFDQAVADMTVGEFVGPVKTQFGYHLIRLNDKRDFPPIDAMREDLEQQVISKAIETEIAKLQDAAKIERIAPTFDLSEIRNSSLLD